MARSAERAINMALRVLGIGEVERDFKRVGSAGEQSFEKVAKAANGADREVSEYTARLKRAAAAAREAFDRSPDVQAARMMEPEGYRDAKNQFVLGAVEQEKDLIQRGLPESTEAYDRLYNSTERAGESLTSVRAKAALAGAAFAAAGKLVQESAEAYMEHERMLDAFEAELRLAGNLSTATAADIEDMARRVSASTLQTEESALSASAELAKIPGITREGLDAALESSSRLADALNSDVATVVSDIVSPAFRALADNDLKGLNDALKDLDPTLARAVIQLAQAGRTADAQAALIDGLRAKAGDGPDGLTTATNDLGKSWERLKIAFGEDVAGPAAANLNLLSRAADWLSERLENSQVNWLKLLGLARLGIPGAGGILKEGAQSEGRARVGSALGRLSQVSAASQAERDRRWLDQRFATPSSGGGRRGGGGSSSAARDAEREAERLKREAEQARNAADRIADSNGDVIESFQRRAREIEETIGLEGAALEAVERRHAVETAARRINTDWIEKELDARRAEAAAAGQTFDEAQARAEVTAAIGAQASAVRELAERYADAEFDIAQFNRRQQEAKAIIESVRTPVDVLNGEIDRSIELLRTGFLTADQFNARMDQLAEGFADVAYEADKSAHAWRGFGNDVGRTLSDIALNGGSARDILQELIRLPLERLLYENVESPIASWIDGVTGNNRADNVAEARSGLPQAEDILGARVLMPAADGAAVSLTNVQMSGSAAAQSLAMIPASLGNPIADLTGEAQRAGTALGSLEGETLQFGQGLAQVLGMISGGGGGGGAGGFLQMALGIAGAALGGGGAGPNAGLVPSVNAAMAANPGIFSSGTDRLPTGKPVWVGENGRELVEAQPGGGLKVYSNQDVRRGVDSGGGGVALYQTINIPERADPRRTSSSISRGTQQGLARASRRGIASPAGMRR